MTPTNPDTLKHQVALGALLAGGIGTAIGGLGLGMASVFCAVIAAGNLAAHRWISTQVMRGSSLAGLYGLKILPTMLVFFLLFQFLSPIAVVLGLAGVLATVAAAGASQGLREASA